MICLGTFVGQNKIIRHNVFNKSNKECNFKTWFQLLVKPSLVSTLRSIITFERWNASVALMRTRSVSRPNSGSSRGPGNSGSSGAQQYLSGVLRGPGFWEKGGEKYLKKNLIRTNLMYLSLCKLLLSKLSLLF